MPTRAAATSTSGSRASPTTAGCPARSPTRSSRVRSRARSRRIRATSRSGRRTSLRPRTRGGTRRGAEAGRAGTSSARRWPRRSSGRCSRSTAAGSISSFPHHENEVAQSRALGHPFAQIWAHNGMLRFTGEKMSKSVGNVATIRETLDEWGREAVLVFFLTASWRKPIDFSPETHGAGGGAARHTAKRVHASSGRARRDRLGRFRGGAERRLRHAGRACRPA